MKRVYTKTLKIYTINCLMRVQPQPGAAWCHGHGGRSSSCACPGLALTWHALTPQSARQTWPCHTAAGRGRWPGGRQLSGSSRSQWGWSEGWTWYKSIALCTCWWRLLSYPPTPPSDSTRSSSPWCLWRPAEWWPPSLAPRETTHSPIVSQCWPGSRMHYCHQVDSYHYNLQIILKYIYLEGLASYRSLLLASIEGW